MESNGYESNKTSSCSSARENGGQKNDQALSPREMDIIKSLDSRSFGFLDLAMPTNDKTTPTSDASSAAASSTISFMSANFLKKGINMLRIELLSDQTSKSIQSKMLCHIAHLHLLLKEYTEALSAYQHCAILDSNTSIDTAFLYGVGLIYFALAKYDWAIEAFRKVLLLAPDFARLNEVHVRMGLMLKKEGQLQESLKHFMSALSHSGPCCITKLEMHFHVGHIHHINSDYIKAKHSFEWILASKNVPNNIKALTLRQLGWLYHTVPNISSRGELPHSKAIELLKLAVSANPHSGQAWYFLGRCHADQGHYKEAFLAYRQSVIEVEGHADTWCAIGILYQQMGQARDSLQAYVTAVFFSPLHVETWTDLGLLYESCDQLIDGFLCYKNGLNAMLERKNKTTRGRGGVGSNGNCFEGIQDILSTRIRFVEHQIQQSGGVAFHSQENSLPTLCEAWSSLVPQHLREKYPSPDTPLLQLPSPVPQYNSLVSPNNTNTVGGRRIKKTRPSKDPIILKNMNEGWTGLSPNKFTINSPDMTPQPVYNNNNNGSNHPLMPVIPQEFVADIPNTVGFNTTAMYYNVNSVGSSNSGCVLSPSPQNILSPDPTIATTPTIELPPPPQQATHFVDSNIQNGRFQSNSVINPSPVPGNYPVNGIQSNLTTPFEHPPSSSSSLLPHDLSTVHPLQFEAHNVNMEDYIYLDTMNVAQNMNKPLSPYDGHLDSIVPSKHAILGKRTRVVNKKAIPSKLIAASPVCLNTVQDEHQSHSHVGNSGNQSDTSSGVSSSHKMSISESSTPSSPSSLHDFITCDSGHEEISPVKEPHPGLGDKCEYMLTSPIRPPSPPLDTNIDLNPTVPIFEVTSYKQAMTDQLHGFCTDSNLPICIIRNLTQATRFDMSLFETTTLMKQCGDHDVEIREQNLQSASENWDSTGRKQVWKCESSRSMTTVQEHGEYQLSIIKEEEECGMNPPTNRSILKFGTNCDLSDKHKWMKQLSEIKKLPKFLQVECPEANLLNHVGHTILGMNSVQLYMKVPGSRTPGHQENNNFCSVNINIGPGDCEWFAVSNSYWGVINQLCDKNKICFLTGSWWPILDELKDLGVPVYRFTQYVGDIVWINPGTVHWVQANSSCNNIAWNVGSLTAHQMRMAWERYQWNKIKRVRSIVPMVTLTWNLARKMKLTNTHTRQQISSYLYSSYKQCQQLLDQLHSASIPVIWHGRMEGEVTPTCTICSEEVFNILFVSTNKKGDHLVHCHRCVQQVQSRNKKAAFTVLQQYTLTELQKTLSRYI